MSDKPISPLLQRMIDDMTARRFTEDTQRDYVRNVRMFAAFLGRSRDTATKEDLRRFQLHMARQQISPGSINAVSMSSFFDGLSRTPFDGLFVAWRDRSPDTIEHAVVLAAVKDAARR